MAKVTPVTSKGNASFGAGYPGPRTSGRLSGYPGLPSQRPVHGSPSALTNAVQAERTAARLAAAAAFRRYAARQASKGKHPKAGKVARGLSPGDVSCCVIQALAASVQGEGFPVTDDDILALHLKIAGPDEYVTIGDGLEAAARYGLAGVRLVYQELVEYVPGRYFSLCEACEACGCDLDEDGWCPWCQPSCERPVIKSCASARLNDAASLILGVTIPAPHAVCDDGSGWLSWGQRYEPWAQPDEMWSVSWQP